MVQNKKNNPQVFFWTKTITPPSKATSFKVFWDKSSDGQTVLGSMGFSIGEMGWLVEIVGLLWAGTSFIIPSFPSNRPAEL